jgi:hypothetical protein
MTIRNWLLILATVALLLPNFFSVTLQSAPGYNGKEKFETHMQPLQTVAAIEDFTDTMAKKAGVQVNSFAYLAMLEGAISSRFYHGFSHYKLSENWIAAVAGKCLKEDYACKVNVAHIMQEANAACSQQALVMMEILRHKKINYRSIGFPHHYALEAQVDKEWYFFDANMEPRITAKQRSLQYWQHQSDRLKPFYSASRFPDLDFKFGIAQTATTGIVNEVPAQRAYLFHMATGILSKILWLLPLLVLCRRYRLVWRLPSLRRPAAYTPALAHA